MILFYNNYVLSIYIIFFFQIILFFFKDFFLLFYSQTRSETYSFLPPPFRLRFIFSPFDIRSFQFRKQLLKISCRYVCKHIRTIFRKICYICFFPHHCKQIFLIGFCCKIKNVIYILVENIVNQLR